MRRWLGASWPDYESPEDVWNEFADLAPNWSGIRYDRLEQVGLQWPCTDRDHPGSPYLHSPAPATELPKYEVLWSPTSEVAAVAAHALAIPSGPPRNTKAAPASTTPALS